MVASGSAVEHRGPQTDADLIEIAYGFRESRTLLTACELDVFTAMGDGSRPAAEIAARIGAEPAATQRLLEALCAMGLLTTADGRYANTPLAQRHLVSGGDEHLALVYWAQKWDLWSHLTMAVQTGQPVVVSPSASPPRVWLAALLRRCGRLLRRSWMVVRGSDVWLRAFVDFMRDHARRRATMTLQLVDLSGASRLLDIGGGPAYYAMRFAEAHPRLYVTVVDRPEVVTIASRNVERAGMTGRISAVGGDFNRDDLGSGYDVVFISETVHANSGPQNASLVQRSAEALLPGGRLVIQDFILDDDRTGPLFASLFSLDMLLTTRAGDDYTDADVRRWMTDAGLQEIERMETGAGTTIMIGHKPVG